MSQVLTVPTHFNDIGELSEGFLDRVELDTLILYGPVAYEDGSQIEFAVLLADGTPALEGAGRVRAAVDGGEDRVPETRYDVVVEALELDGRSEVVFERLVLARQAISDRPAAEEEDAPVTGDMDVAPDEGIRTGDSMDEGDEEPIVEESEREEGLSIPPSEVVSVSPDGSMPDTVPPEPYDDEDEEENEPATVVAAVDANAMMTASESEPASEFQAEAAQPREDLGDAEIATVIANATATEIEIAEPKADATEGEPTDANLSPSESPDSAAYDSMYAFEHGIADEPRVGMPVPVPSMAAPPEEPPAPPTLRLAEPPEGLTRPSLAQPEDDLFSMDEEVSDVHATGLFVYDDGLPIPSRPPLPDPARPRSVRPVEAVNDYDVEEASLADEYEEVRLSDFAEAVEEG